MKQTVLITGSTSGIGEAWSRRLAKEGYNLILVGRNTDKLKRQQQELLKQGVDVCTINQSLEGKEAATNIVNYLRENNLTVDLLINNAGFNESGYFKETSIEKEKEMIQLHIITLTELTKLLLPDMIKKGYGRILNVGSTGSYISTPCDAVYSATKAYVLSFSKALAYELKGTGVKVSTLCPGATQTEFAKKAGIDDTLLFKLFVMEAEAVVNKSYKGFIKGKKVIKPGWYTKLLIISSVFTPDWLMNPLCMKMIAK